MATCPSRRRPLPDRNRSSRATCAPSGSSASPCSPFSSSLLLQHSWYLWDHFDLTADFGQYSQAWQQIATGHLNPYDTTYAWYYPHYGYPFYQADLELIMWPLALLYWVWPHAIDLLIVQDAALAGAGLVAFRWVLEHLQLHAPNRRFAIVVAGAVGAVLVLQPWTYWAASYDYHSEPLAAFFVLLAGRDLWSDRRRGWIWVALALTVQQRGGVVRGRPGDRRHHQRPATVAHRPHPDPAPARCGWGSSAWCIPGRAPRWRPTRISDNRTRSTTPSGGSSPSSRAWSSTRASPVASSPHAGGRSTSSWAEREPSASSPPSAGRWRWPPWHRVP